jgi:hypothetical protein
MSFPEAVGIKYGAFTLCCRKLLEHLSALNEALQGDTRCTVEDCIGYVDQSMQAFFQRGGATDLPEAVGALGGHILGEVGLFRRQSPAAAVVFDRMVETMAEAAPTWCYEDDLEAYHRQGRALARSFCARSPWAVTQECLSRKARLVYDYGLPDPEDLGAVGMETFGYRAAPLAYRTSYEEEDSGETLRDVIIVRFLFDHDFALYRAYPYLFLHEYTAHIYSTDHGNDRFNDGWMLHAAATFLWDQWNLSEPPDPHLEQADCFYEHLYSRLNPVPRQACRFARQFGSWLATPERFWAMTHELAAFEPQPGRERFWPNQFLNALEREFKANRIRLRQKIEAAPDVKTLWSMLAPI